MNSNACNEDLYQKLREEAEDLLESDAISTIDVNGQDKASLAAEVVEAIREAQGEWLIEVRVSKREAGKAHVALQKALALLMADGAHGLIQRAEISIMRDGKEIEGIGYLLHSNYRTE